MAGLVGSLRLPMTAVFVLLLILVMVGFNALYVAAEFATVGSRRSRIQETAASGSGPANGLLAILKEPRLDGLPHVLICVDVLSPRSRWMTEEQKQKDAFELLGAEELQIIDPRTNQMRRFLRTTI